MSFHFRAVALLAISPLALAAQSVGAANSAPQPVPIVNTIPASRDIPYPGTIRLEVDATDTARAVMKVKETIPVATPGRMTLYLPKWLPGAHGPDGPIDKIAGLDFTANGQKLTWQRDPVEVYAFHVAVPAGVTSVEARFNYLSPIAGNQGRIVMTPEIVNVQWEKVSLYPAGYFVRQIPIVASLTLPSGWQAGTALRPTSSGGSTIQYGQVSYETLIDSPVFAGINFRRDDLGQGVSLVSVADSAKNLKITPEVLAKHRAMVDQEIKVFGAKHFDHYDFLNALSDKLGGIGLEHHRSTEISSSTDYYTDYDSNQLDRNVFPHEFTHSWDGKFRRPADLWTPDYHTPMRDGLLWVYEGQTQFWGNVVEARSGMTKAQDVLDNIAYAAAALDNQKGRTWRPLVDTTYDPIIQNRTPQPWGSFMRNEDYYNEGMLIWIEADAIIRQGTGMKRGMDDFAKAFFGINPGDWGQVTYTRDDVIKTLNSVYPYDWAKFLHERVDQTSDRAPLGGFTRSGYELRYTEEPTATGKARAKARGGADFTYSLGFSVSKDAKLGGVVWGSPAFTAALRGGDEIVAVGDKAYSEDAWKDAVTAAKAATVPVRLTIKRGDSVRTYTIDYHGGLRHPRFVKVGKGQGPLDLLLKPR
jgi:predicted metalloprotease with PDZ domain